MKDIIDFLKRANGIIRLKRNMQYKNDPENIKLRKAYKKIEEAIKILVYLQE